MGRNDDNFADYYAQLEKLEEQKRARLAQARGDMDKRRPPDQSWEDNNPPSPETKGAFERFKSFVDDNLTTLSEGIRHFPRNIAELKARMQQEREARQAEELDISSAWTGSKDSPDYIRMCMDRASKTEREEARSATFMLLREAYERSKSVPDKKMIDLYRDNEWSFGGLDQFANPMLSNGGACYYKAETVENLPSTARWGWPTRAPQWLSVDWFKRSPYSPVRLRNTPMSSGSSDEDNDFVWRAAFEELLSAALDKPMDSREKVGLRPPHGKPQSTHYGPGLDWMLSLQCRGILPPQLPSLYRYKDCGGKSPLSDWRRHMEHGSNGAEFPFPRDPLVARDFQSLLDEISIKSGPETEAAPLHYAANAANAIVKRASPEVAETPKQDTVSAAWQVPETEEDLYTQIFGSRASPHPPPNPREDDGEDDDDDDEYDDEDEEPDTLMDIEIALAFDNIKKAQRLIEKHYANGGDDSIILRVLKSQQSDHFWGEERRKVDRGLKELVARSTKILNDDAWRRIVAMSYEERDRFYSDLAYICEPDSDPSDTDPHHQHMPRYMAIAGPTCVERLLGEIERERRTNTKQAGVRRSSETVDVEEGAMNKPSVLSQLTTTQRTRSPDGTVTTKVVLKQRFADGTEQEHERVQTSYEEVEKPESKQAKSDNKAGWFWS